MDRNRKRPTQVELESEALAIRWKDGRESRFALTDLRRNCPCAGCAAAREASGTEPERPRILLELPVLNQAAATDQAQRLEPVGRYGIRIVWADGHDTGIYTFERLRREDEDS